MGKERLKERSERKNETMNENPNQTKGILRLLEKINSKQSLVGIKKLLLMFSSMLIIASVVDMYTSKMNVMNVAGLVLACLMMNFAQRIDTKLLKIKINKWLEKNLE